MDFDNYKIAKAKKDCIFAIVCGAIALLIFGGFLLDQTNHDLAFKSVLFYCFPSIVLAALGIPRAINAKRKYEYTSKLQKSAVIISIAGCLPGIFISVITIAAIIFAIIIEDYA